MENSDCPLNPLKSIKEIVQMFPDYDPELLFEIYKQLGRDKDMLVETMLNDGVMPEEEVEDHREEEP